ncbi:MAG: dimethylsulfoniopropionate demethylase, partial [Pseudomonadota bacterium]
MQSFSASRRTRRTPLSSRVEAAGARAYTVYNHMLLATAFGALEEDYRHLRSHAQVWDVSCQRIIELKGRDAARLAQLITPRDLSRMTPGRMAYAPLTDETGAILNDPVILQ